MNSFNCYIAIFTLFFARKAIFWLAYDLVVISINKLSFLSFNKEFEFEFDFPSSGEGMVGTGFG